MVNHNTPWNKGLVSTMRGKHFGPEFSKKVSLSLIGSKRRLGTKTSPEARKRMSLAKLGKTSSKKGKKYGPMSEEMKSHFPKRFGKDNHFFGKKHTPETIEKIKEFRRKQIMPQDNSFPERKMQSILSINGIKYEIQRVIKIDNFYHKVDIFIEPNICVEVYGCYHHGCEKCFNDKVRNGKIPTSNKKRDEKINKRLPELGYKLIILWTHEINQDLNKCLSIINFRVP